MDDYSPLYDEKTLVERLVKGDEAAFDALFHTYWDQVYSFALVMTKSPPAAQDISQEVFVDIFTKRNNLADVTNFRSYLFQMAKFKILTRLRRNKVETAYKEFLIHRIDLQQPSADASLQEKNLHEAVLQAIEKLPPQQRTAFQLSRMQGLTHEQISVTMGISKKTVKDYIVRAIAFLRKHLYDEGLLMVSAGAAITFLK
ncbi:MAG: RNA polymerase sigma-70 factor [Chitinophagaceae bacterium]|nr:RNA polymerase sigma-70 factor [Chitinophagaceae bacterium]